MANTITLIINMLLKKINKNYMTQENFIDLTEPANQVLQAVYIATNKRNIGGEIPEIIKCSSKIDVCQDDYLYTIFDHFFYNIDILELTKLAKIEYSQGYLYEFDQMLNFEEINGKYWQDLTEEAKNIITISLFRNFTNLII